MIPVLTKQQAYQLDKDTIESGHLSQNKLMDNAGRAVADFFLENIKNASKQKVLIICGKGNNGGDGIVTHYYLRKYKINSSILLCEKNIHEDLLKQYKISNREYSNYTRNNNFSKYTYIIDGIFGIGLSRKLTKKYIELINMINKNPNIISIDIPSGLNADSSKKFDTFIKAAHTVTFGYPKLGHYVNCIDHLHIKDIGFVNLNKSSSYDLIDINDVTKILKPYINKKEIHKYTKGIVAIAAGGVEYPGAAILSAQSALKAGAGYVHLFFYFDGSRQDEEQYFHQFYSLFTNIKCLYPEIILHHEGLETDYSDNVLFGPGIVDQQTSETALYYEEANNFIIDAGGFKAFPNFSNYGHNKAILTPHMGEFKNIFHLPDNFELNHTLLSEIQDEIEDKIIILKSFNTFIITKSRVYIMDKGPSILAVAGTGDVLSGILISLLSQGYNRLEASILGTYLHAESANYYRDNISKDSMTASDLINCIPHAYNKLRLLKDGDG